MGSSLGQESSVIQALSTSTDSNATRGRPRDREQIRKSIIEAARRVAAREGTANFSMSLVADEAGFASGTVYGYFRTKNELLLSVFAEDLTSVAGAMRDMAHMESEEDQPANEGLSSDPASSTTDDISPAQTAGGQGHARTTLTDSLIFIAQHAGNGSLRSIPQALATEGNSDPVSPAEHMSLESASSKTTHTAKSFDPADADEGNDAPLEAIETLSPVLSEKNLADAFFTQISAEYCPAPDSNAAGSEEMSQVEDEPSRDFVTGNFDRAIVPTSEDVSATTSSYCRQSQDEHTGHQASLPESRDQQFSLDREATPPATNFSKNDDTGLSVSDRKRLERAQLDTIIDRLVVPQGQAGGNSGAVARLERRVDVFERELTELLGQQSELKRTSSDAVASVGMRIDVLADRFETNEQRHRATVAELRGQILDISNCIASIRVARDVEQPDDISTISHLEQPVDSSTSAGDVALTLADKPSFDILPKNANNVPTMGETFLAAARRSASAASVGNQMDGQQKPKSETMRYVLLGGAALVALILLGFVFNHKSANTEGATQQKQAIALQTRAAIHKVAAIHPVAPKVVVTATAKPPPLQTLQRAGARMPIETKVVGDASTTRPKSPAVIGNADLGKLPSVPASAVHASHPESDAPLDRLTALAQSGNAKAELVVGLKYLDGEGVTINKSQAARWLQRAAAKAHPVAQYRLGTLYQHGLGVPRDVNRAMHWYQAAAERGNTKAMYNLAFGYAEGWSGAKDYAQAARWFSSAARLGYVDAQFNLAVLYERGAGVPQSLLDAYKWYSIAEQQGDKDAKIRVEAISTQLSAPELSAAQQAAVAFRPKRMNYSANSTPVLAALLAYRK